MNAEQFTYYLKNPSLLHQITYQELNSLVSRYPYCQNLRYLLAKKSQLDDNKDYIQNLQLAATFSIDRSFFHAQIQKEVYAESESESFILRKEHMELKDLPKVEETNIDPIPEPVIVEPVVSVQPPQTVEEEQAVLDEIFADENTDFQFNIEDSSTPSLSVIEQLIQGKSDEELIEIKEEYIPESIEEIIEEANNIPDSEASNKSDSRIIFIDELVDEKNLENPEIADTPEEEITEQPTSKEEPVVHEWDVSTPSAENHSSDSDTPLEEMGKVILEDEKPSVSQKMKVKDDLTDGIEEEGEEASTTIEEEQDVPKPSHLKNINDFYTKEKDSEEVIEEQELEVPKEAAQKVKKVIRVPIQEKEKDQPKTKIIRKITRKSPAPKESFSSWLKKFQSPELNIERKEESTAPILKEEKKKKKKKRKPKKIKLKTIIDQSRLEKKKKKKKKKKKSKVKKLAMKSISESEDIASETLAKILANQGSYEKAIKMYKRLMLIFPEKSTFFAERIDKLKKL